VLVRRYPAKNVALSIVAIFLFGYLVLSGAAIPTIRSYAMVVLGSIAVLMNRKVLSLRNALIVFMAMMIANPYWLVSVGFQLSFAAVIGLIYYFRRPRFQKYPKLVRVLGVIFMMDVISTIWTAPFVVYHFHSFPLYTLLGNVTMLPIFSFIIMPAVLIGAVTALFGFTGPLLISDAAYSVAVSFAKFVASFPSAMIDANFLMPLSLFLISGGMVLFLIGRRKSSAVIIMEAIIYSLVQPRPILRTTADSEIVGFYQDGATYFNVNFSERHRFIIPHGNKNRANCRRGLCIYKTDNWTAVSTQRFMPVVRNLDKLCDYDFIISYLRLELADCPEKVIRGSVKIYKDGRVERIERRRRWN
jgi:competence protein ComEC